MVNLTVGNQLRLGLGLIALLVAGLVSLTWYQTDRLWLQTEGLYEHPLQVRRALGELTSNIKEMRHTVMGLCLSEDPDEHAALMHQLETAKIHARQQLAIIRERYLGPAADVEALQLGLQRSEAIREETLRLASAGHREEALDRLKDHGVGGMQVASLMSDLDKISAFARNRADSFYRDAQFERQTLRRRLSIAVLLIVLVMLLVIVFLLRSIQAPLTALTTTLQAFRAGNLHARCTYAPDNEFGTAVAAFNAMAEAMQRESTFKEQATLINVVMLRELETQSFCRHLLETLMQLTHSQMSALYLLNDSKSRYELLDSVGVAENPKHAFEATVREGELGLALGTGKVQHLTALPSDTFLSFSTVTGSFTPKELLTLPLSLGPEIPAVISLATLQHYDTDALRLVTDMQGVISTGINTMLANRRAHSLNLRLNEQNRELEAQTAELAMQADALGLQKVELEQQARALEQANRLKTTFLSNMSHELRTPLNSVIALSGVLGRRLAKQIPDEEYSYLEVIERNGKHLLNLINDVLDLARIEAGREELMLERFSLKDLADELLAMLEPQAREKHIALTSAVPAELPSLLSDRLKCRHILQNLLANGVKFTEVGRVELAATCLGHELQITVTDTGIGIPNDRLELIFEEFRQADEHTSRKYGGTGLGLAIAKKYTAILGGTLTVISQPGRGSTFTLRLPLVGANLQVPTEIAPSLHRAKANIAPLQSNHGRGKRILLVEDNEAAIVQVRDLLAREGYELALARSGQAALVHLQAGVPDAVILDLMMPEVDGFAVLKAMRDAPSTAEVPVLILSAKHVTKEELSFLRGNHIHQLLQKGDLNGAELLATIAAMLTPPTVPAAARQPRRGRVRRAGKPIVLVVEDNPDNMITARALLKHQYEVIEAGDGKAGVELALQHQPDLVLMDISLPLLDGIQALRAMRAHEQLVHIPVVALTASAMKGNREEILAHGFDRYLAKPIDAQEFLKTIRELLDGDA